MRTMRKNRQAVVDMVTSAVTAAIAYIAVQQLPRRARRHHSEDGPVLPITTQTPMAY
jgi:hypothetical protein